MRSFSCRGCYWGCTLFEPYSSILCIFKVYFLFKWFQDYSFIFCLLIDMDKYDIVFDVRLWLGGTILPLCSMMFPVKCRTVMQWCTRSSYCLFCIQPVTKKKQKHVAVSKHDQMCILTCPLHWTWDTCTLKLLSWLQTAAKSIFSAAVPDEEPRDLTNQASRLAAKMEWKSGIICECVKTVECSQTVISWGRGNPKRAAMLEGSACAWGGRGGFRSLWVRFFFCFFFFLTACRMWKHCKSTQSGKHRCTCEPECPHSRVTDPSTGRLTDVSWSPPGLEQAVKYGWMIKTSVASVANRIT